MLSKKKFLRMMDPKYNYSRKKTPSKLIFIMVFVFLWLFTCVWFSSQSVKFNYEINKLSGERDDLRQRSRMLEIRLQAMMSGKKIGEVAKKRYGFKNPSDNQVYIITDGDKFFEKLIRAINSKFIKEKKV